jgi:hypothetical protein
MGVQVYDTMSPINDMGVQVYDREVQAYDIS